VLNLGTLRLCKPRCSLCDFSVDAVNELLPVHGTGLSALAAIAADDSRIPRSEGHAELSDIACVL